MGLGRRAAVRQVVPAELPDPQREPQRRSTSRNRSRRSFCTARATAPGSTCAATTSRACRRYDWQKQQPVVTPVLDYDKRINGPARSAASSAIDVNVTSLTREADAVPADPDRHCRSASLPVRPLRDLPSSSAASASCAASAATSRAPRPSVSWRRNFIDRLGQVWTPFAYLRADVFCDNAAT